MKTLKTLFILSIFFYSFTSFSQSEEETSIPTAKGNFVIGGSSSSGFSSITSDTESNSENSQNSEAKNTSFGLRSRVGYFVIDNLAVGGEFSFSSGKRKSDALNSESTNTAFGFSPFARYYFTERNIKPFIQGNVGVGFSNSKGESDLGENEFKTSNFNYGFDGGVAFFLGDHVSIDLAIGYLSNSTKPRDNNDDEVRFTTDGFSFNAGFHIFF